MTKTSQPVYKLPSLFAGTIYSNSEYFPILGKNAQTKEAPMMAAVLVDMEFAAHVCDYFIFHVKLLSSHICIIIEKKRLKCLSVPQLRICPDQLESLFRVIYYTRNT